MTSVESGNGPLARLADRLGTTLSVSQVVGTPIERNGTTVVPVAKVGLGFGGGVSTAPDKPGEGGGGGGGARPVGFIEIRDGAATYHPVRDPWRDVVVPVAVVLALVAPWIVRALTRPR
ncbi:GerW family sporulation protein [Actinocatenispora rupis]|uniref:Sporulation protein YtfJ (Spore_YtfJ) n=1 Tax=Actinocatenispora rupis TaxID=519421 RepID=A0A8J3NCC1_9ACTN|nr:spore germination protein GerW family protein [Actinocatenispora rupis]GID10274.1 hypothetical protein Aru02nite_11630 [Actinocatenispora rupis]